MDIWEWGNLKGASMLTKSRIISISDSGKKNYFYIYIIFLLKSSAITTIGNQNLEKNSMYSTYLKGPWNYACHTLFLLFFIDGCLTRLIWVCSGDKIFWDKILVCNILFKLGSIQFFSFFFIFVLTKNTKKWQKTSGPFKTWIYGLYWNISHKVRVVNLPK